MNMKINLLGPFYTLSIKIYIIWQDVKEYKHLIKNIFFPVRVSRVGVL